MTITFLDPRDQSTKVFTTEQIKQFIKDLKAAFSRKIILDKDILADLLAGIRQENKNNVTIPYLYIDIEYYYVPEIVNVAEQHGLPILLRLTDLYDGYKDMITLFRNKKCLKSLSFGPPIEYKYFTERFIDTLLTTDIYGLTLSYITPHIDIFYRLITVGKLIKLELNQQGALGYGSQLLNKLFQTLQPGNKLKQLMISDISFSGSEAVDESNSTFLATLIMNNVNLTELSFSNCSLSYRFLNLLFQKLLQLENKAVQPVKLNLSGNRDLKLVVAKIAECLAADVPIRDLDLSRTGINEAGARLIGAALAQNTVLNKLALRDCPIDHGVQAICQGILSNPDSNVISLDFKMVEKFDLDDAHILADLIRANKIRELFLHYSFHPQVDKVEIYKILLEALAENSSLVYMEFYFKAELLHDTELYAKLQHVFLNRTVPIKFEHVGNYELKELMNLQLHNYAVSSKTLIQILQEYQK